MEPNSRRRRACCRTAPPAAASFPFFVVRLPCPPRGVGRRRTGGSFRRIVSAPPFVCFLSAWDESLAFVPAARCWAGPFRAVARSRFRRTCAAAASNVRVGACKGSLSRLRLRAGAVLGSRSVRWSMLLPHLGALAPPRVIPSTASSLRMLVITAAPGSGEGAFSAFTLVHEDHLGLWSPCWKRRSWAATRVENTCRCGDVQRGSREGKEGEARPGRLLAGMVTQAETVTHSRAHSASAFASTGDVPPTPLLRRLRKISRPDVPAAGYTALLE